MAEQYSIQLDLAVGQLFSRLDQLERRLGGVGQAAASTQSVMDRFQRSATVLGGLDAAGARMQRTLDLMTGSARNTNEGMRRLERQLQTIVDKTDRGSQAFAVATQNLERYRASLRGAGTDADRFAGRVGGLQAVMGAVGAAAIVNSFKAAGVEAAGAERKLGFLTKGFGEYEAAQASVVRVQKELGISNTEAKQGISNLYAALRPTGVALGDIEKAFLGYAKAARQTGQSNAEVSGGMLQLKQALGSGTLQGDELRSIRENAPAVAQAIARVMDTTVGGLKELGSQGKISSAIVLKALGQLAEGAIPPVTAMDRLSAAWTDFQAAVAGSIGPLTSGLIGFAASILEGFQKLPGPIKDVITAIGALALAVVGLAGAFVAYSFATTAIVGGLTAMGVATTATTGLFGALALAAQTAWASIAWPIVGVVAGVALLTKAAYDLNEPFAWWVDNLGPAVAAMWNDVAYIAKSVGNDFNVLASDIKKSFADAPDWFKPLANELAWLAKGYKEWEQGGLIDGYLVKLKKRVEEAKKASAVEKKVEEEKAKAQQLSEKQLKKLAEARAKMEKGLTDARKDAEGKIADLRESTAEKAKSWELEIAQQRLDLERQIADMRSQATLDQQLSEIDKSIVGDGSISDKVKADQKVMLQAKYDMEQKIIGVQRNESDRQKAFTEKLESFKLETVKAAGRIQQAYSEKAGQVVEGYSTASAKILMAGGQNAGAAIEASATRAAQVMSGAAAAAASSGVTDSTPFNGVAAKRLAGSISGGFDASGENGADMPLGANNAIKSYHNGVVKGIGTAGRNGNYIIVEFMDDMGNLLEATYSHVAAGVRKGERVVGGQVIGKFDGSGNTSGGHNSIDINSLGNNGDYNRSQETAVARRSADLLRQGYVQGETRTAAVAQGRAQQAANPIGGPNSVFSVNGPNTPSSIFQIKADPIAALANSAVRQVPGSQVQTAYGGRVQASQGAMQGPSMKSSIPLGQKAVLGGQAVKWNGQDWVPDTISAAAAPVGGAAASQGTSQGRMDGYLKRLAYLETEIKNVPNAKGSGAQGYFQAMPAFRQEAISASGGLDPRSGNYDIAAKATKAWIAKHRPEAYQAIQSGQYDRADAILKPTWPSLPGGSQAQNPAKQAAANQFLQGGASSAIAAAGPANNIVPLPAGFDPASVGTVDPNQYLGGVKAAQGDLDKQSAQLNELKTAQEINLYLEKQKQLRASITSDLTTQNAQAALALQTDQQVLALIEGGINPALAEQFVQVDQTAAIERARLEARKTDLEAQLEQKGIQDTLKAGLQEELQLVIDRLAAEGGITQEMKNQITARQALAKAPKTQITQKVAQMKQELADTGGMIISLSDTIENELGSAMSSAISGVISGTTTVQEAFSTMFSNIGKAFIDMATQMIAKALIMKVLGILGGAMGGSSGGLGFGGNSDPLGAGGGFWGGPSFAGGGYTGDSPRSGGVDGQGGFPAILHPQETVVDHTRLRSGMGGGGGESGGASPITLNVTATKIGDSEFVKVGDLQVALRQNRKEAAADGEKRALAKLQNSPRTRAQLLR